MYPKETQNWENPHSKHGLLSNGHFPLYSLLGKWFFVHFCLFWHKPCLTHTMRRYSIPLVWLGGLHVCAVTRPDPPKPARLPWRLLASNRPRRQGCTEPLVLWAETWETEKSHCIQSQVRSSAQFSKLVPVVAFCTNAKQLQWVTNVTYGYWSVINEELHQLGCKWMVSMW